MGLMYVDSKVASSKLATPCIYLVITLLHLRVMFFLSLVDFSNTILYILTYILNLYV